MILLTGVLDGYLRPGAVFRRGDVAGMLADRWLPAGALFAEDDVTWEVAYEGERGLLISSAGVVLWQWHNGHDVLWPLDRIADRLGY